jgi:site-specific DNA-methyltransferase (adenine-specific)
MNSAQSEHYKKINEKIDNDGDINTALLTFDGMMQAAMPHLADEADIYVFTSWQVLDYWYDHLRAYQPVYGITLNALGVWDKGYPGKGDLVGSWGMGHEFIFYMKKGRRPVAHRRSFVIAVDRVWSSLNIHPTEKPVELMERLIAMSSDPGDLIFDPFSGSGAVSVAAQKLGRNSIAFETDDRFIEPSRQRLTTVGLGF